MADKINYSDVFSADFLANLEKTNAILKETESFLKSMRKGSIKFDGGASAIAANEKIISESLKNQKLLADIEKKRIELKQLSVTLTEKELKAYAALEREILKTEQEKSRAAKEEIKLKKEQISLSEKQKNIEQKAIKDKEKQIAQVQKSAEKLAYESREYVQLSKAHTQAANSLKDLIVRGKTATQTQKEFDTELRNAQLQFNVLHKRILDADHAVDQYGRTVGKYPQIKEFFTSFAGAAGIGLGINGFVNVMQDATNIVKNFDARMAELSGLLNVSDKEMEPLKNTILDLGASTKFTATQVGEAAIELTKLGFSSSEIQDSLKGVLDGAVGMGVGVPEMAELASKSIRAFGLTTKDTERVVSTFAASANTTATSFQYLNDALPYASTAAKTYGMSLEQTTALLGILADNGFKAEQSGVALRDIFTDLSVKGITFDEAMSMINNSTDKAKTAFELFGKTSVNQGIVLANNIGKFDELTKAITNQDQVLKDLVDKRLNTLEGALAILESAWEGLILSFEDGKGKIAQAAIQLMKFAADILTSIKNGNALTETISNLFNKFQDFINALVSITANLIPVSDKALEVNDIFEILGTTLEITTTPLRLLIDLLTWLYETADYVIDNFTPLNEIIAFSAEIFGQVANAIMAADTELNKYIVTNKKFGVVSKAIIDLLNVTISELMGLGIQQTENVKTTDQLTDAQKELNKETERYNTLLRKYASEDIGIETSGLFGDFLRKDDQVEFIKSLDQIRTKTAEIKLEFSKKIDNGFFGLNKEELNDLKQGLSELADQGVMAFESINEANQMQTELLIEESDKRIELLRNEYDKEKELQEQRKEDGKAYDEARLNEIKKSIAAENAERAKQVEQLKKYQRRAILIQLAADNAKAISSAIAGAATTGNPILFAIQLASMLLQIGASFTKAQASLQELEKYKTGGWIDGESHENGGKVIEAEGGEYITAKKYAAQSSTILEAVNSGKLNDKMLMPILFGSVNSKNDVNILKTDKIELLLQNQNQLAREQLYEIRNTTNGKVIKRGNLTIIRG